jgi:hypothetical protein
MRVVRDRADARWLPSRARFAISRLIALLVMSQTPAREHKGLVLVIDRDQNAIENHVLGAGAAIAGSAFIAGALTNRAGVVLAIVLAVPLALIAYSALVVMLGLIVEPLVVKSGAPISLARRINGLIQMGLLLGAAVHFATRPAWVRPVAVAFLTVVALNVIASVVMIFMRSRVAALDRRFEVES